MDDKNKPVKVIGVIQDVTEQKLTEANLKALGESLNLAQKVAGVGSFEYDVEKDKVYGSDELLRIFNIKSGGFNNNLFNFIEQVNPDDQYKAKKPLARL